MFIASALLIYAGCSKDHNIVAVMQMFWCRVLTDGKFAKVDKSHVKTFQDPAIAINLQNQRLVGAHITKLCPISSEYCTFLTKPGELAKIFLDIKK